MSTSLIKILIEKEEHLLIDSIYNVGMINGAGVLKVLEILSKKESSNYVCLKDLLRADYDNVFKSMLEDYVSKASQKIISKYEKRAMKTISGEIPDDNYLGCHVSFGNGEIGISFSLYTESYESFKRSDGTIGWIPIDSTFDVSSGSQEDSVSADDMRMMLEIAS